MLINVDLEPLVAGAKMGLEKEGKSLYFNNRKVHWDSLLNWLKMAVSKACMTIFLCRAALFLYCASFFVKKQNGDGIILGGFSCNTNMNDE